MVNGMVKVKNIEKMVYFYMKENLQIMNMEKVNNIEKMVYAIS